MKIKIGKVKNNIMTREGLKKHWESIEAYRKGANLEIRVLGNWIPVINPNFVDGCEYRILDPLREFKEAYERGEMVEVCYNGTWYEFKEGEDTWEDTWKECFQYRIKKPLIMDTLEVGDELVDLCGDVVVVLYIGNEVLVRYSGRVAEKLMSIDYINSCKYVQSK